MTPEQKEYLIGMLTLRPMASYNSEENDKRRLKDLRQEALNAIRYYKDFKKEIEEIKLSEQKIKEIVKEIEKL